MARTESQQARPGMPGGPWQRVASMRDLRSGRPVRVRPDGRDILLVMVGGDVHACGNTCAHQHFSVLHSGQFRGHAVTCPMHGWTFDVRTGLSESGEGRIPTYRVSVRGDDVYLRLA